MNPTDDKVTEGEETDVDVTAARWFHRLDRAKGGDVASVQAGFQHWLHASPDHADAFARTAAIWQGIDEHAAAPEMMALRQAAIADSRGAGLARWRPRSVMRPAFWPRAAAACLVAVTIAALGYEVLRSPAQIYETAIGERRSITLADNSRVEIDADSRISVNFTTDRRVVHILQGQAYFKVQKDPARPFIVESNGREVIATGTEFDVEALDQGLRVTLVEGHVVVRTPSSTSTSGSENDLAAGDQLTDVAGSVVRIAHLANPLVVTAWRQGKILFDNEPLADAVARLDRYSHVELVADASVAQIRVGGAFDADDTAAFVHAVTSYYPIDAISDRPGELRLVRRR